MKVHLIKRQTLEHFARHHVDAVNALKYWLAVVKGANWEKPTDILATFGSADLLGNGTDRIVFDIGAINTG